jgi:ABC-type multidrug transport system ATPase subunit
MRARHLGRGDRDGKGVGMTHNAIEPGCVCKSYKFSQLQNIELQLPRGTIMGLIGPNGAGKSTTIRIPMGLLHQAPQSPKPSITTSIT